MAALVRKKAPWPLGVTLGYVGAVAVITPSLIYVAFRLWQTDLAWLGWPGGVLVVALLVIALCNGESRARQRILSAATFVGPLVLMSLLVLPGATKSEILFWVAVGAVLATVALTIAITRLSASAYRTFAILSYLWALWLWFGLAYFMGQQQTKLDFRMDPNGDFGLIEALYLSAGVMTTAGAPGITPASPHSRLIVTGQMLSLAVVAWWLFQLGIVYFEQERKRRGRI